MTMDENMTQRFTRQELYDLVWSKPMSKVAAEFGMSDVGFKKHCKKSDIPVPERGYWAKLARGKKVRQPPLPPKRPGERDEVVIHRRSPRPTMPLVPTQQGSPPVCGRSPD